MRVQTSIGIATITIERALGIECGDALHRTVLDVLEDGHRAVVVDLAAVSRVDAAGLGQLMSAFRSVRASDGALTLVASEHVRALLDVARVPSVIPTFASVSDAVANVARHCCA